MSTDVYQLFMSTESRNKYFPALVILCCRNQGAIPFRIIHTDHCFPLSLCVRAKTILSGVLIREEEDDPNSTRLTLLLQNDPMGWIPKSIVNFLAARAPVEWQETLSQFYHDVYVKEKDSS